MAKYWMHNGLMQASGEVGKVGGRQHPAPPTATSRPSRPARSASRRAPRPSASCSSEFAPETIRFFLLSTHYRRPIDFSQERLHETEAALENFYRFFKRYERVAGESFYAIQPPASRGQGDFDPGGDPLLADAGQRRQRFLDAMDDDFNTGGAIGDLFELLRRLNKFVDDEKLEKPEGRSAAKLDLAPPRGSRAPRAGRRPGLFPPAGRREAAGRRQ